MSGVTLRAGTPRTYQWFHPRPDRYPACFGHTFFFCVAVSTTVLVHNALSNWTFSCLVYLLDLCPRLFPLLLALLGPLDLALGVCKLRLVSTR
jgi:hypothetical protein